MNSFEEKVKEDEESVRLLLNQPSAGEKLYCVLENECPPSFSWQLRVMARMYAVLTLLLTLLAVSIFMIGTLPRYYLNTPRTLLLIEYSAMMVFTFDYFARLIFAPKKLPWFFKFVNMIDLLTVIPFWFEIIFIYVTGFHALGQTSVVLRTIRMFRVLRVIKLTKYSAISALCVQSLIECKEAFMLLFVSVSILVIISGGAVYYLEQTVLTFDPLLEVWLKKDGTPSAIQSIFSGCWWSIITISTVGYGDIVPEAIPGKIVAGFTALVGILVFAFPISIFSTKFYSMYTEATKKEEMKNAPQKVTIHDLPNILRDLNQKQRDLRIIIKNLTSELADTDAKLEELNMTIQELGSINVYYNVVDG